MKKLYLALFLIIGNFVYGEVVVTEPIDVSKFENNFYVGQVGFYLPQENFLEAAQEYFLKNDQLGLESVEEDSLNNLFQKTSSSSVIPIMSFIPEGQEKLIFKLKPVDGRDQKKAESYFACLQYMNANCVAEVIGFKEAVQQNITDNDVMLNRLEYLIKSSDYIEPIFSSNMSIHENNYPLGSLYRVYVLSLSKAILNIHEGKIEQGLDQLNIARKRINIAYHAKSMPLLSDIKGIIAETQSLDQVMDGLLNSGLLTQSLDSPILENIVKPYVQDIQLTIQKSLLFEVRDSLKNHYQAYSMYPMNISENLVVLDEEDEYILLSHWQNTGVILSPAFEARLNDLVKLSISNQWETVKELDQLNVQIEKIAAEKAKMNINNIDITALNGTLNNQHDISKLQSAYSRLVKAKFELYQNYINELGYDFNVLFSYLNSKYPSDIRINALFSALDAMDEATREGVVINRKLYLDILRETHVVSNDFVPYEELMNTYQVKLSEQQNYHQLVYLKYLIMKDKISMDKISEFLASMGDLAKNTVTKSPYLFDEQTHILSTPLPEEKYTTRLINSARWKNKDIKNYEVKIPMM